MMKKWIGFVPAVLLLLLISNNIALPERADDRQVLVHEWGTFTSVAGRDGKAVQWRTYRGRADLPCFVNSFGGIKGNLPGSVRMETPVLYFYTPRNSVVDVSVRFPKGTITEWYPKQSVDVAMNSIAWHGVRIDPNGVENFPRESDPSHYYAARDTDAEPLQVGTEREKFLFYRGIATFSLPLSAEVTADSNIVVKQLGASDVDGLILFDNHEGTIRYTYVGRLAGQVTLDLNSLRSGSSGSFTDLERDLIKQGLYPKEAHAMIETWRDSWFEEGTRLFYIVPRKVVDEMVPLDIRPAPAELARVFVGRMEIITPAVLNDVSKAIASGDRRILENYGRFLEPIAMRLGAAGPLLDSIYSSYLPDGVACK